MEPRTARLESRFQIEKLEERIAPAGINEPDGSNNQAGVDEADGQNNDGEN